MEPANFNSTILNSSKWIYRSYHNYPSLVGEDPSKALQLIFGEGQFSLTENVGKIDGTFDMGNNYVLDVTGDIFPDSTAQTHLLNMIGLGRANTPTEGWRYDYKSFLAPTWREGTDQIPAFVGTVIRALPHNGEPAGVTASFILLAAKNQLSIENETAIENMIASFQKNILPKFRAVDINCMRGKGIQLSNSEWMRDPSGDSSYADHANARRVFAALSSGDMPPDGAWPQNWLDAYQSWIDSGFQP